MCFIFIIDDKDDICRVYCVELYHHCVSMCFVFIIDDEDVLFLS
jgi:hypothetical protein